jgi:uncharacterized protein YdeI (YjbR/CyaY-like superfamily)
MAEEGLRRSRPLIGDEVPAMRYRPKNREDWRNWLSEHHASRSEVWLVFLKKSTGRANLSYNDAVEEAVCFGWIDGLKRSIDEESYMHRFTPRKRDSKWSTTNKARAERMIEAGKMTGAGEKAIELARKSGAWSQPAEPPRKINMPPELRDGLGKNSEAAAFFDGLAPSCQRQYMTWIDAAKRPETRARRVREAIDLLSSRKRLGMR